MKYIFLILLFGCQKLFSQKAIIDHQTPRNWPRISSANISPSGQFVYYSIGFERGNNSRSGTFIVDSILIIKDLKSNRTKEISAPFKSVNFSSNGLKLFYLAKGDSLIEINLDGFQERFLDIVAKYEISPDVDSDIIAYRKYGIDNELVIKDLYSNVKGTFENVGDFYFYGDKSNLIVEERDSNQISKILVAGFRNGFESKVIAHHCRILSFNYSEKQKSIVFIGSLDTDYTRNSIRYYSGSMDTAAVLAEQNSPGMKGLRILGNTLILNEESNKVFFYTEEKEFSGNQRMDSVSGRATIYSYLEDYVLGARANAFYSEVSLDAPNTVKRIQQHNDNGGLLEGNVGVRYDGKYLLVYSNIFGESIDNEWRITSHPDLYLINTDDISRKPLKNRLFGTCYGFSPNGRYVLWFDRKAVSWFTFDLVNNRTINISHKLKEEITIEDDHPVFPIEAGMAKWSTDDGSVFVYGRFDIWKLDPSGVKEPTNVTHGYGKRNNIEFRIVDFKKGFSIDSNDTLLICGFSNRTKQNSFYSWSFQSGGILKELSTSNGLYYFPIATPCQLGADRPFYPIKASHANAFLLSYMSSIEYPNLCVTKDFIKFQTITNLEPQKAYNWYTDSLIYWKLPDGKMGEGILYRPENFNRYLKYPVIVFYYERCDKTLDIYIQPELSIGTISIPYFISNGYIVFIPNIYYKIGAVGSSAYNYILSGAKYLSKFNWVDSHRMGLQGHSFGGWETDFVIAHTPFFAAAASSSGFVNLISSYGRLGGPRGGEHSYFESSQGRIGATLWNRPDLYIGNSPVFGLSNITTPLLIMHNHSDNVVPFDQEAELFSGLCRLNKKVWLLSYDKEGHTINYEANELDFSIKLAQFFNCYLKGTPAPSWMTLDLFRR